MKLKVLGSVSPYCKDQLNCPGYLIDSGKGKILLDCGSGSSGNMSFPEDIHNLNIGTIKAQPYSLSKTTAFTANNKIFPILEYYTCRNEEKDLVAAHIINYSMTVGAIGKLKDYIKNTWQYNNIYARNFIKGTFLKLKDIFEDYHYLNALNEELNIGVYFDEYTE